MQQPALWLAAGLLAAWLALDPHTPDLAAQVYRAQLFDHLGMTVWDEHWYAGHHLPGYSLLFGPLAWLLGLRVVGALSVLASVALFWRLARRSFGAGARWGTACFAVVAVGDVWIGRLAFALGVSFALGAALCLARARSRAGTGAAALLAAASAAASPVAGALLALAGLTHWLAASRRRSALALAGPPVAVIAALALLFPEGGYEPFPAVSFLATALVVLAFEWALPRHQRLLRIGAWIYLLACLADLLIQTPMGSNAERYGVLLAGPLLVCALGARRAGARAEALAAVAQGNGRRPNGVSGRGARAAGWLRAGGPAAAVVALCGWAAWAGWGPLRETLAVAGNQSTSASYYAPLKRFLATHASAPVRVEVPLTRSHWETALLADEVSLARGWEKQLDTRYDRVLLAPGLTAASYRRWLQREAVGYVALPDTRLDPSSAGEGRLIRAGLPYLRQVFASRHWRVYEVLAPAPLASGPGRLSALGHDSFALQASSAGSFLVRVHFTRYWTLVRGRGCVRAAPGGWTAVQVRAPGPVEVAARFSLQRALGLGGC